MNNSLKSAVLERLTTQFVGRNLLYFASTTSTNDVARQAAREGAPEGTAVVAEEQTEGRARLGRSWINPPGVLAVSIILRPPLHQLLGITIVSSLATSRCIRKATGLEPRIKWPNDVLLKGLKVSGILTESALRGQSVDWAVTGIGINVNFDPAAFPEISSMATSLSNELGRQVSQVDVLVHLFQEFEELYLALRRGEPIHLEWKGIMDTLGRHIRVTSGKLVEEGYADSVGADGSLLLRRSDGSLARIIAGEVTLRT
ncbi:MAG: biotin--[acetyl-CoA-carboxylase] ligase [Dehalococcoidia bacterium]|nr:biotin--[acetyl-CoA-carboxylase] ligase [Dehalococcoidia bacterium]